MAYDLYPAVDETYNFPVEIRRALATSPELRSLVIPMTTTFRNNLTAAEKWDGRVIANTTIDRLERYDQGTDLWSTIPETPEITASQGVAKQYVDSVPVRKNRIINGNFAVNQRGISNASVVGNYVHDRWVHSGTGGTMNYSALSSTAAELPEGPHSYARLTVSGQGAATDSAYMMQRVEGVATLHGKKATLSFWAKSDVAGKKLGLCLIQVFGTGGSASVDYRHPTVVTLSTAWQRYSFTVDVPSIAGMTIGSVQNRLAIEIVASSGPSGINPVVGIQNGTVDLWGVQLEEGPVATPFQLEAYDDNLRRCKRFYVKYAVIGGWIDGAAGGVYAVLNCPDAGNMRQINSANVQQIIIAGTNGVVATNPIVNINASPSASDIYVMIVAGQPPGAWLRWNNFSIDAELI